MSNAVVIKPSFIKNFLAGILGNILEHYDNALYALLVPFLSPLFFTDLPYVTGLIVAYGIQVIGILTRPLGALVFGYIGDRYGRKYALSMTITGMAIATVLMGCLPTYANIGNTAPLFLLLARALQNFFVGGETKGGAIFILEHSKISWRGFLSSIYDSSSIIGVLFASGLVTLFAHWNIVETHWRWLFWLGGCSGVLGISVRWICDETLDYQRESMNPLGGLSTLKANRKAVFLIIFAAGFSYVTYAIPFTLMNGFLPLISSVNKTTALEMNTSLLCLDVLLLPIFGFLTRWISGAKLMRIAALSLAVLCIPLFFLLKDASIAAAIFVRSTIIILGVAFAAPFHQWTLDLVPVKDRYLVTAFATSIGSQLIGSPCAAICLWLYQGTGWILAPAVYLFIAAVGAFLALSKSNKKLPDTTSNTSFSYGE
ncbi:MAG: MFS transporter [Simkania sp.]|nr:MFS transporter [Simkania sp.]